MKTRVQQFDGGLAVPIPAGVAAQSGLSHDCEVDVTVEDGAVIARPVVKPRFTLEELLRQITDENRHPETDTGPAMGQEVW